MAELAVTALISGLSAVASSRMQANASSDIRKRQDDEEANLDAVKAGQQQAAQRGGGGLLSWANSGNTLKRTLG